MFSEIKVIETGMQIPNITLQQEVCGTSSNVIMKLHRMARNEGLLLIATLLRWWGSGWVVGPMSHITFLECLYFAWFVAMELPFLILRNMYVLSLIDFKPLFC